jgi:hypothetical protein
LKTRWSTLDMRFGTIVGVASGLPADVRVPIEGQPGSLSVNKAIVIDTSASAVVLNVTSPAVNGTYGAGAVIPITVQFDRVVFVQTLSGSPMLQMAVGAIRQAPYVSGSGTDTLTFNYVVQPGDSSADLSERWNSLIVWAPGFIQDVGGVDADPALPVEGTPGSLSFNKDIVIDGS